MYSEQGTEHFAGAVHEIGEAYYWRGYAYRELGQIEEAERDIGKAKELGYEGS
jgi:Flp pilus assembly protein TadD